MKSPTTNTMNKRGHLVHLLDGDDLQWKQTFISFGTEAVLDSTPRVLLLYSDISEINLGKATRALMEDKQASRSSHKFFFSITRLDGKSFHFGTMDELDRQQIVFDLMDSIGSCTVASLSGIKNKKSIYTEMYHRLANSNHVHT